MPGTRIGGKKSAKKIGRKALAERGSKGGANSGFRGFRDKPGLAQKAGTAGGQARARKYQDPNFDKKTYQARRAVKQRGQNQVRTVTNAYSPDEWDRRKKAEKEQKDV